MHASQKNPYNYNCILLTAKVKASTKQVTNSKNETDAPLLAIHILRPVTNITWHNKQNEARSPANSKNHSLDTKSRGALCRLTSKVIFNIKLCEVKERNRLRGGVFNFVKVMHDQYLSIIDVFTFCGSFFGNFVYLYLGKWTYSWWLLKKRYRQPHPYHMCTYFQPIAFDSRSQCHFTLQIFAEYVTYYFPQNPDLRKSQTLSTLLPPDISISF